MLALMNRTDPSPNVKWAPPEWNAYGALDPSRPEVATQLSRRLDALADEISQGAKKPKKGGGAEN